jgi:hypothetical protein
MNDVRVDDARIDDTRFDTARFDDARVDSADDARTHRRPSREQFSVGPYQVQHLPTGAKFGAYPGENDLCYINWGRLSERYAAQDYCDELRKIARELLRERSKY